MAQCQHMTDLAKDLLSQRDEALAQNAALSIEAAMLRAALAGIESLSHSAIFDSFYGRSLDVSLAVGRIREEALAALAAPSAVGGEHGSALLAAGDALADLLIDSAYGWDQDCAVHWRRLRGASAGAGQGAGDEGGAQEPNKNDADF